MKIGDLVRRVRDPKHIHLDMNAEDNIGVVVKLNTGVFEDQVKVKWTKPTWYDPDDGLSAEYAENLEVIGKGNYLEKQRKNE